MAAFCLLDLKERARFVVQKLGKWTLQEHPEKIPSNVWQAEVLRVSSTQILFSFLKSRVVERY